MRTVLIGCAVGVLAASGYAGDPNDVFPPYWRGYDNTVLAAWDFWGQGGPGPRIIPGYCEEIPDIPLRDAAAYIDNQVWVQDDFMGRQSVLEVGIADPPPTFSMRVPTHNAGGIDKMMVRVQITYWLGGYGPEKFGMGCAPGDPPWPFDDVQSAVVLQAHDHGDGWQTGLYAYIADSCEDNSWWGINVTPLGVRYPIFVDAVWIDTLAMCTLADFNLDGIVNTRDVLAFLNAWVANAETADIDGNGVIDTRDVLEFLNVWSAGGC